MAKSWAIKFYSSVQWQECRKSFIAYRITVDGGVCQHCVKTIGYIADHIVELTPENISNPEIALNHENLQWLCLNCHTAKTFKIGKTTRDDVMFDNKGDLISNS